MIKFLDLYQQYLSIQAEIDETIAAVIRDSAFIGGTYVNRFEEAFAAYHQARYCIGVGNGTDALEIALEALELPPRSKILVPANSFIASAEAVTRAGHRVVFCDCDPQNYTLAVDDVRKKIDAETRAIIAVHLYGHPADMDGLLDVARAHNLKVLEDCAQAHGAEYKGRKVGTFGEIGTFSFYPGKNLGAYGDGGAIVTNTQELADSMKMLANHGRIKKYDHEFEGRNSRLDGLQAAILSVKLRHLDRWIDHRRTLADHYRQALADLPEVILPVEEAYAKHVYHLFVIRHPQRDRLQHYLREHDIQTGIHYPIALPKLAAYSYLEQAQESMLANSIDEHLLSLPIGEHLSKQDIETVAVQLKAYSMRTHG